MLTNTVWENLQTRYLMACQIIYHTSAVVKGAANCYLILHPVRQFSAHIFYNTI